MFQFLYLIIRPFLYILLVQFNNEYCSMIFIAIMKPLIRFLLINFHSFKLIVLSIAHIFYCFILSVQAIFFAILFIFLFFNHFPSMFGAVLWNLFFIFLFLIILSNTLPFPFAKAHNYLYAFLLLHQIVYFISPKFQ